MKHHIAITFLVAALSINLLHAGIDVKINPSSEARPGRVHALLIGTDSFKDKSIPGNAGATADCADFADLLRKQYGLADDQVTILTGEQVTAQAFAEALKKTFVDEAQPGDTVIFYYSGMSSQNPDLDGDEQSSGKDSTFLCFDSSSADSSSYVTDDILGMVLKDSKASTRIVILDACHAAGFADGFEDLSNDTTAMAGKAKTLFIAACAEDEMSLAAMLGGADQKAKKMRGVFTYYLTRSLREFPNAKVSQIGAAVASQASSFATSMLQGRSSQTPEMLGQIDAETLINSVFGQPKNR
jgi:hypothetical protein